MNLNTKFQVSSLNFQPQNKPLKSPPRLGLKYSIYKKITVNYLTRSNYDCRFIIKELAKECEGQFTCLGEGTEKHITFSLPTEKELTRIGKIKKKLLKPYLTG